MIFTYNAQEIINSLEMAVSLLGKDNSQIHQAFNLAHLEIEKLLEGEHKDAYEHARIAQQSNFEDIIGHLKTDGFVDASKQVQSFCKQNSIFID